MSQVILSQPVARRLVFHGVKLEAPRGDFLVVIDPNAGGKTTLLKLMPGLLDPNRGTMVLKDGGVPSALSIVELPR